ncbi:uncharacterized protein DUF4249 [Mucilaginibacter frigoritolerans]|uniref:Uncharacterized protein DUF4249 n=1 Tax=Mucilaginibacter frigoritolerans TaxID=652788 RepID=A0A562U547_9SPHI|nr:DUF4249 domain-containing protein [Mucilaginibacter frigoritolerans]TWJ00844.1 uncharacterized protein DUF4249 [Mucilaginibacter frigoritolerans]
MRTIKLYISFFIILGIITSCTKVIDLKLGNVSGQLVIEGNVTQVPGPQYIKLSRNVAFTSTNTYPAVSGATVSVTDSLGNIYPFTESPAGTYSIPSMAGKTGNTYTMTVVTGGKTYTAKSTMPGFVHLDSITSRASFFNTSKNLRQVTVHFQDPAGIPNQYRFVLYVNSVQVKSVFAFNDDFSDGRYSNIDLIENDIDIHPGDTAKVEMQCIDKPIYTYWYTLMQQDPNGPGGGVTPSNPPTNITPTTLGYFSAHTTQTETFIVK